jgi:hypothetical protein
LYIKDKKIYHKATKDFLALAAVLRTPREADGLWLK